MGARDTTKHVRENIAVIFSFFFNSMAFFFLVCMICLDIMISTQQLERSSISELVQLIYKACNHL